MPKIVVYVRADDARLIEKMEECEIELWVRALVRDGISDWHTKRIEALGIKPMPEAWQRHQADTERGA